MTRIPAVAAALLAASACTPDFVDNNRADVLLNVVAVSAQSGSGAGTASAFLLSDVSPVFNDNVTITLAVIAKNANNPVLGSFNNVYLEHYDVRFVRSDGRDQEGVDVPYSFSGLISGGIPAGGATAVPLVVVRHSAKEEPPLRNMRAVGGLAAGGGLDILNAFAIITVYGRTTSGQVVRAVANLQITFSDFADAA
jgi:hypothetical protein